MSEYETISIKHISMCLKTGRFKQRYEYRVQTYDTDAYLMKFTKAKCEVLNTIGQFQAYVLAGLRPALGKKTWEL